MSMPLDPPDLRPFFAPQSVAFVGATDDLAKFGGRCLKQMLGFGFAGRLYPINPRRSEIAGHRCYASILDVPEVPEHVGILVPADRVLATLGQCAERGVRFATVFSGGFAETGTDEGRALQREACAFAAAHGLRFMGPNCNGLINFADGFAMTSTATISGPRARPGNVAVIAHSGGLGQVNVMWRAQQMGIGVSYEVSCGNEADLDVCDFARWMIDGDATDVVLMALEAVRDGAKLAALAAHAGACRKPIVMLKFGRTEEGRRAALSHTGAMTGTDEVHDAALRELGIIRVDDCDELCETAMLLRTRKLPRGRRVASLSLSGGNVVQLADAGARVGLAWSDYGPATRERLGAVLPALAGVGNPTDLTSAVTGAVGAFQRALEAIADDPAVDTVVPTYTFARRADLEHAAQLAAASAKPFAILWTGASTDDPAYQPATMAATGVAVLRDTLACMRVVRAAAWYAAWLESGGPARAMQIASARRAVFSSRDGRRTLTERESKQVLAAHGLTVTREVLARSADEAVRAAASIGGAVALKIESADIAHKSDIGAVCLGLTQEPQIRAAFDRIMAAAREAAPDAVLNGVLVQEMVEDGLELILGVTQDPSFGPVVMAGLGGIHAEVLHDVAYRLAPVTSDEAQAMLAELRGAKLLDGVRGAPPRDVQAAADAIAALSHLAVEAAGTLLELDINPLLVRPRGRGAVVVDALIVESLAHDEDADTRTATRG
jgi:acyl-CoA synthetase (NDP forming)